MKLISVYTDSHIILKDQWFLPSLQDNFEKKIYHCAATKGGGYLEEAWSHAVEYKNNTIISEIKNNWGEVFIYSDVDIQFLAPIKNPVLNAIRGKDIACQLDDPQGNLCTGFVALRCNEITLRLYELTLQALQSERRDQLAFNRIIRAMPKIKYGYFPKTFFGGGTFSGKEWVPGMLLHVPQNPIMHHANFTIGIQNKVAQLEYVRNIVTARATEKPGLLKRILKASGVFDCGRNKKEN